MSGVAGGDRIHREDFDCVVHNYLEKVLKPYIPDVEWKISGSYHNPNKVDFGDIDLIVTIPSTDKKQTKVELQKYLESLSDSLIVPFKSEKYKGKRSYNSGEIVTVLFPQQNGKTVQIDNIISLSSQETDFKVNFLDLPAEKQGLILGLVKVSCIQEDPKLIFQRLDIPLLPYGKNQEYEFNLSAQNLTLRLNTYEEGTFKEIERQEIWKSNNWNDVVKLLNNFDLNKSFEDLLDDLVSMDSRSRNRIFGIFKSMITVKSGEVGTPKGLAKENALHLIKNKLNL